MKFIFAILLLSQNVHAAIPSAQTIFSRYTHNVGKAAHIVEQEVQFQTDQEAIVLHEKWIVESAGSMYLTVTGDNAAKMEVLYKDGRRVYFDNFGNVKSAASSKEFIEPFLYYRNARSLTEALIGAGILPGSFSIDRQKIYKIENYKPQPEPLVQLSRSGGVITYQFGELTPANQERLKPGFWIDQDSFFFRRLRFPSQAEVAGDKVAQFSGNLHLPRERTVSWDNHSAFIRVLSVKNLGAKTPKPWSSANYFTGRAGAASALKLPASDQVIDFYSRFR